MTLKVIHQSHEAMVALPWWVMGFLSVVHGNDIMVHVGGIFTPEARSELF